jgi:hypothetical protein
VWLQRENQKVTYAFVDSSHCLCLDKKDIIWAELEECQKLLKYAMYAADNKAIEKEMVGLKMTLLLLL